MADLLARRERLMGAGAPLFYEEPLNIVRGEGVWLFDVDGRRYLICTIMCRVWVTVTPTWSKRCINRQLL